MSEGTSAVPPEHRDPEDGMTDVEAAYALFDAVMEGRGRENVTLEELRREWASARTCWSDALTTPLESGRQLYYYGYHLIHALEQRVTEVEGENGHLLTRITQLRQYRDQMLDLTHRAEQAESERVHAIELLSRDYASRAAIESPWRMQLYLYEKQKKQLQQAEDALAKCEADRQFIVDYTTSERERQAQRRAKQAESERDEARRERDRWEWVARELYVAGTWESLGWERAAAEQDPAFETGLQAWLEQYDAAYPTPEAPKEDSDDTQ